MRHMGGGYNTEGETKTALKYVQPDRWA